MAMEGSADLEEEFDAMSTDNRFISDTIKVNVIPEKKGTFLKHTEYEITSAKNNSKVERRYNDFVQLHSWMMMKYSNRMIPRLPPKHIMLDAFLEERRSGLQRWLRLMGHHALLSDDKLFKIFLTDTSEDHQSKLQEEFSSELDELLRYPAATKFPKDNAEVLVAKQDEVRIMLNHVVKIRRMIEQQAKREMAQSTDFAEMASALSSIAALKDFSDNFLEISKESEKVSVGQQQAVVERLEMIIDALTAHSDMCDRIGKRMAASDPQTLSNTLLTNTDKLRSVIRGSPTEASGSQHHELEATRRRNGFAIYCVISETELAQRYFQILSSILLQYSHEEAKGFGKISEIFNKIIQIESDKLN